jgi:cytochrome c-type biogenesis protein CcmE
MKTQHKVLVAMVLIIGTAVWALSGTTGAAPFLDVHHITDDPDRHDADELSVRGYVMADSIRTENQTIRFQLSDASGDPATQNKTVNVVYQGVLPDAFGPKMAVITGALIHTPDGLTIQATDIQVGCSSKY